MLMETKLKKYKTFSNGESVLSGFFLSTTCQKKLNIFYEDKIKTDKTDGHRRKSEYE